MITKLEKIARNILSAGMILMIIISGMAFTPTEEVYAASGVISKKEAHTDSYGSEPYFEITNTHGTNFAFCIDYNAKAPNQGTAVSTPVVSNNDALRRVLYYGNGGPADLGTYTWTFTAIAASSAAGNIPSVGDHYTDIFSGLPVPPAEFKVYIVSTGIAGQQDLAYWRIEKIEEVQNGALELYKRSSNESISNNNNCYSLEGAVIAVYKHGTTEEIGRFTTDKNGYGGVISNLISGKYDLKEIKAPKGFVLNSETATVTINAGQTVTYTLYNEPANDPVGLLLKKIDAEGNTSMGKMGQLAGAQYTFEYYDGQYSETELSKIEPKRTWIFETDENSMIYLRTAKQIAGDSLYTIEGIRVLPIGTLKIYETKAPVGYNIDPTVYVINITDEEFTGHIIQSYQTVISSEQVFRGGVELQKIDDETGNIAQGSATLAGAEFTIYNRNDYSVIVNGIEYASGEAVLTLTTDAGGYAASAKNALPYGDYEISETKAPDGYILDSTPRSFSITTDGEMVSFTGDNAFKNTIIKGYLKLEKTDSETGEPLAGAEFGIYSDKDCTKLIQTLVTDENGEAVSKSLVDGMYYVKELKAPAGYATSVTVYSASIAPAKVTTVKLENTAITVTIEKICSETGKHIIGAELIISDSEGNEIERWISANKPHVIKPIPVGTYTLTEIRAPFGYQVSETVEFTVSDTNEPQIITMKDAETYGKAIINKTDEDTGEPLEGVTFEIRYAEDVLDAEDNVVIQAGTVADTLITDKKGYAESKLLPIGTYGADGWTSYISYEIQEIKTIDGYIVDDTIHEIKFEYVDDKTPVVERIFDITNDFTKVEVIKISETGEHIYGAELILRDSEGTEIERWISSSEPYVIERLPVGIYTLTEIRAPFGYQAAETVEFEVKDTAEIQSVIMVDAETYGKIIINKTDEITKKPLAGVTFEVRYTEDVLDAEDNVVIKAGTVADTLVTDEQGYAESKLLPIGTYGTDGWTGYITYELQEIKNLEGYVLDNTVYEVQFQYIDDRTLVIEKNFDISNSVEEAETEVGSETTVVTTQNAPIPGTGDYSIGAVWIVISLFSILMLFLIINLKLNES